MPDLYPRLSAEIQREAMLAFTEFLDVLIQRGGSPTPEAAAMLEKVFMSGVQWGLDHKFMDESKIFSPFR